MKISVVIPALNETEGILAALRSVQTQIGEFDLLIVDGGSVDGTVETVRPLARVIRSEQGRAVQMNAGAEKCSGEALLFLHADSLLPPDALPLLEGALADRRVVGGTFMLRFDRPKFLLGVIAFFSRFKFRYFHYGDQGIFVRRSVFHQLGGFRGMPIMEDLDFLLRLRRTGRVVLIKQPVTTSARRFLENGILWQQLLNIILVISYLLGARPESLSTWHARTGCRPLSNEQIEPLFSAPAPTISGQIRRGAGRGIRLFIKPRAWTGSKPSPK
jgi:rSAM/selenodomain-associated transferase 2